MRVSSTRGFLGYLGSGAAKARGGGWLAQSNVGGDGGDGEGG